MADAQIVATAHLTDDLSGVDDVSIYYLSPSGTQSILFRFVPQLRTGGTALDGTYETIVTVGTNRQAGPWTVSGATTKDAVGNTRSYTASGGRGVRRRHRSPCSPTPTRRRPSPSPPFGGAPAPLDVSTS